MAEAQAKDDKDPSVEEILQSIRRIIAEDGDEAPAAGATPPATSSAPTTAPATLPAATGSDVLELTDIVKDDGTVVNIKTRMPEPPASAAKPVDVLSNIDNALATPKKEPVIAMPAPATEKPAAEKASAAPAATAPAPKAMEMPPIAPPSITPSHKPEVSTSLISEQAVSASAETFRSFAEAATRESMATKEKEKPMESPAFRSGATVEDLVVEALRPMLKEWLDKNLSALVQKIVEKEIRRIADSATSD